MNCNECDQRMFCHNCKKQICSFYTRTLCKTEAFFVVKEATSQQIICAECQNEKAEQD